jgi:hypothetical protein
MSESAVSLVVSGVILAGADALTGTPAIHCTEHTDHMAARGIGEPTPLRAGGIVEPA